MHQHTRDEPRPITQLGRRLVAVGQVGSHWVRAWYLLGPTQPRDTSLRGKAEIGCTLAAPGLLLGCSVVRKCLELLARREGFEPPTPRFEAGSKRKK